MEVRVGERGRARVVAMVRVGVRVIFNGRVRTRVANLSSVRIGVIK